MVLQPVLCPTCQGSDVARHGQSTEGKPRYKCRNQESQRCTFILSYTYRGHLPEVKQHICHMALNGSGIRDTARVLKISPSTVIEALKKSSRPQAGQQSPTRSTRTQPNHREALPMGRCCSASR